MTNTNISAEEMDKRCKEYAGNNYAQPRRIQVSNLDLLNETFEDIDDVIEQLTIFRNNNDGMIIECEFESGGYDEYGKAEFTSYRLETSEEVERRVETYREHVRKSEAKRRALYESMKKEFEQ
jgi:hypothetical protein